ncbi:Rieske (2Fe-2S) domain-containing protein [Oleiphilus messinensis]|uniref:Rieske (2Fe-2S) domain-containing protein n=1 Tax=Oleiphilus messinensis TaxID=141451 RepID=A0A1Y0IE91_9GAMM|nr:Rieske (2Fe-2S) protein [Oleiphilus messinensis]ARU58590.1 Rieske (2Fe-2S) domain-containing protein [Oleiphilus messinensis]
MPPNTQRTLLCSIDEIEPNNARGFEIQGQSILVVRHETQVYAYLNQCPHTGVELNWMPDRFMDLEKEYIQCSVHGALFKINNGLCIAGPCQGRHLQKIPVAIENNLIYANPDLI